MEYEQFYLASSLNKDNYIDFNNRIRKFYEVEKIIQENGDFDYSYKKGLNSLFMKRKNSCVFNNPISRFMLIRLLDSTFYKSYPSAGALYGMEIYCFIINVYGVAPGIYKISKERNLELYAETEDMIGLINTLTLNYHIIEHSSCYFIIVSTIENYIKKYGDRGFRFLLQESGHLAQNIILKANELNLKTFISGGYMEKRYSEVLSLTSNMVVLYELAIGK